MVRDEQKFKDWKKQKQLRPEQDWHKSLWGRIHEFGGGGEVQNYFSTDLLMPPPLPLPWKKSQPVK